MDLTRHGLIAPLPSLTIIPSSGMSQSEKEGRPYGLVRRFFFVNLVALQFGIDSTLWLPTVYSYVASLHDTRVSYYVSMAQFLSAAVQFVTSMLIGPIVAYFGASIKWGIVVLVFCSAVGNFIYSCAGRHAISSVWAIVGGRLICGIASGSTALAMAYIVSSSTLDERLPALSLYRTFGGIAFVIGPLLSVVLTLFTFHIGLFAVSPNNASTFVASGIFLCLSIVTALGLADKKATQLNFVSYLTKQSEELFLNGTEVWLMPFYMLFFLFISAFLMAGVQFIMSDLLRSPDHWGLNLTLISGLQAIVFFFALFGSLFAESFRKFIAQVLGNVSKAYADLISSPLTDKSAAHEKIVASVLPEIVLSSISFAGSIIGAILVIVSLSIYQAGDHDKAGSVVCFLLGCILSMLAYNVQAASLPSLYSKSIPPKLRVIMTPWYGATVALGKLAAPPIIEAIGSSRTSNSGWIGSQALCIGVAIVGAALLYLSRRTLLRTTLLHNA